MSKSKKIQLQLAIIDLEQPYPSDDLILSYADFLKVRDTLPAYPFNPIVFDQLLQLTISLWTSDKRINRLSLLQRVKQYYHNSFVDRRAGYYKGDKPEAEQLTQETKDLMFTLFQKVFQEPQYISPNQLEAARNIGNNLLINLDLSDHAVAWLCSNSTSFPIILNRVLRYPKKTTIISNWARTNMFAEHIRARRAEQLAWIIDEQPGFEISKQTLLDDFEALNRMDIEAIRHYYDEVAANDLMEKELSEYLPRIAVRDDFDSSLRQERVDLSLPTLHLSWRAYWPESRNRSPYQAVIPDFNRLRAEFYENIDTHQKITMIWAIVYSHLDNEFKYALLKQYYCIETYYSMFRVAKKTKNLSLLKWLLTQQ